MKFSRRASQRKESRPTRLPSSPLHPQPRKAYLSLDLLHVARTRTTYVSPLGAGVLANRSRPFPPTYTSRGRGFICFTYPRTAWPIHSLGCRGGASRLGPETEVVAYFMSVCWEDFWETWETRRGRDHNAKVVASMIPLVVDVLLSIDIFTGHLISCF